MSCIHLGRTRYDVTEGLDVKCTACLRLSAVGTRCTRCKFHAERLNHRRAISDTHRGKIAIGERRGGENKGAEVEEEHQLSGRVRWEGEVGGWVGEEPPRPQMNHARPNFVTPSPTALSPRRRLRSCPLMIMDRPCELISVAARPPWI